MTNLTKSLLALVAAGSMALIFAQPALAQTAGKLKCNGCVKSKQLKNNGVKSKDMKPDISLGTSGNDGDLSVKDTSGTRSVSLDGATGNVTNLFANTAGSSNGLVKAWARIASDGTVRSCWRCSTDPALTMQQSPGVYLVDFTPLTPDVRGRPRSAVADDHDGPGNGEILLIGLVTDPADASRVAVGIRSDAGTLTNADFTVILY